MPADALLELRDVRKHYPAPAGRETVHAVNGVSFRIEPGEIVAIVGESGCGKSTIARLSVRLTEPTSGKVLFQGSDIAAQSQAAFRPRRRDLQMVFQDAVSTLNPRHSVARLIAEPLLLHSRLSGVDRARRVAELGDRVRLPTALLGRLPSQLSGGQLQRVGIARAIATSPALVVLDEPTSALDLSVRASILDLLAELRQRLGIAMLLISHDLTSVRRLADRVLVTYLGRIVESGPVATVLSQPSHPYTRALLAADLAPTVAPRVARIALQGEPPSPVRLPPGCGFAPRCAFAMPVCVAAHPASRRAGPAHDVSCLLIDDQPGEP